MIYVGDKKVKAGYLGDVLIGKVYLGDNLLYQRTSRLPAGYIEVEYITNPNLSYVYTTIVKSTNPFSNKIISLKADLSSVETTSSYGGGIFGWGTRRRTSSTGAYSNQQITGLSYRPSTKKLRWFSGTTVNQSDIEVSNDIHEITVNTGEKKIYVDGELALSYTTQNNSVVSVGFDIFRISLRGYTNSAFSGAINYCPPANFKLYAFKMQNTTGTKDIVIDFVPCIAPDGVAGLYDMVSNTFVGTAANGFVAGPPV